MNRFVISIALSAISLPLVSISSVQAQLASRFCPPKAGQVLVKVKTEGTAIQCIYKPTPPKPQAKKVKR